MYPWSLSGCILRSFLPVYFIFTHTEANQDRISYSMLPSISSGQFGIFSKPVYGSNCVHGISHINKPLQDSFDEEEQSCPSLPLISEGSFTSLVSKKSGKSLEKSKESRRKDYEVSD